MKGHKFAKIIMMIRWNFSRTEQQQVPSPQFIGLLKGYLHSVQNSSW